MSLPTYETLLKEISEHPGSTPVEEDQYQVESVALIDLATSDTHLQDCSSGPALDAYQAGCVDQGEPEGLLVFLIKQIRGLNLALAGLL
jgi:hypothetical protein